MAPMVVIPKCTIVTKKRHYKSEETRKFYFMQKQMKVQKQEYEETLKLMKHQAQLQDQIIQEQAKVIQEQANSLTFVRSQWDLYMKKYLEQDEKLEQYQIKEQEMAQVCLNHQDSIIALLKQVDDLAGRVPLRHE